MKKSIIILAAALLAMGCNTTQQHYKVKCDRSVVTGHATLVIDGKDIETKAVKDGKVTFKGVVEEPAFAQILNSDREPVAEFIVEKGTINVTDAGMTGTPSNDVVDRLGKQLSELVNSFYTPDATPEMRENVQKRYGEVIDSTFKANTDNFGSVALLIQMMESMPVEEIQNSLQSLSPEMQNHSIVKKLNEQLSKFKTVKVGDKYVDFSMPDATGGEVKLSSLVGANYVLLDFWASWCAPCMAEVPNIKFALTTYPSLTFVGVSLDEDADAWKSKLKELSLGGVQLSDGQGWYSEAVGAYGVNSIPANFLIAPDGTVVAKNLRGENLTEQLAQYLK